MILPTWLVDFGPPALQCPLHKKKKKNEEYIFFLSLYLLTKTDFSKLITHSLAHFLEILNGTKGWFTLVFLPDKNVDVFVWWTKISWWLPRDITIWKIELFLFFKLRVPRLIPLLALAVIHIYRNCGKNVGWKSQAKMPM